MVKYTKTNIITQTGRKRKPTIRCVLCKQRKVYSYSTLCDDCKKILRREIGKIK